MTASELWALVHGIALGALYLLGFSAGFVTLWRYQTAWLTPEGLATRGDRMPQYLGIMATSLWLTVIVGTYLVYPAYRAPAPETLTDLAAYPRSLLLSDPAISIWHSFGMEWKEHVAWLAPMLATAVAVTTSRYRSALSQDWQVRRALLVVLVLAFVAAGVAGLFGALITKVAPVI